MRVIRKRRMRFARCVAFMEEMRNIYKTLENLEGSSCWGDLSIDGRNLLREWTGFLQVWVVSSDGFMISCKCINKPCGFIKDGSFLGHVNNC
jgi:hypothetical protein